MVKPRETIKSVYSESEVFYSHDSFDRKEDIKAMFEKDVIEVMEAPRRRKGSIYFWNPRLDGRAYEHH